MTPYEKAAIEAIHAWKSPRLGWFGAAMKGITWPLEKVGDFAFQVPGVQWVIEKSFVGALNLLNDGAQYSVSQSAFFEDFRKCGHLIQSHDDIRRLDLESI